jgi:hypothetical protein
LRREGANLARDGAPPKLAGAAADLVEVRALGRRTISARPSPSCAVYSKMFMAPLSSGQRRCAAGSVSTFAREGVTIVGLSGPNQGSARCAMEKSPLTAGTFG